jgi:hypothetical protein
MASSKMEDTPTFLKAGPAAIAIGAVSGTLSPHGWLWGAVVAMGIWAILIMISVLVRLAFGDFQPNDQTDAWHQPGRRGDSQLS